MTVTVLASGAQDSDTTHTISLTGATAGKTIIVSAGIPAVIDLDSGSAAAGWVQDSYYVNNQGLGLYRLDGSDNAGGTLPDLKFTHNGARQLAYVALQTDIVGGPSAIATNSYTQGSTTLTTLSETLSADDILIVSFDRVRSGVGAGWTVADWSTGFSTLADSGEIAPSIGEWVRQTVGMASSKALVAEPVYIDMSVYDGTSDVAWVLASYSEASPPAGVTGDLTGVLQRAVGSFSGVVGTPHGSIAGVLQTISAALAGTVSTNTGNLVATISGLSGSFQGVSERDVQGGIVGFISAVQGSFVGTSEPEPLGPEYELALTIQRQLTHAYILEQPTRLILTPRNRVRTASGGFSYVTQTPRVAQLMRIIESSLIAEQGVQKTETGFERVKTYQLMCEWNATIAVDDTYEYDDALWEVRSFMPNDGYQRRAMVARIGR